MKYARFAFLTWILGASLIAGPMTALAAPGDLDPTFAEDGKLTDGLAYQQDVGYAVAVQPDGKIVVAGITSGVRFGVTRYNPDGSLDTSFGNGGKVTSPAGSPYYGATAVAIQSDGKIVVVGRALISLNPDFAAVRYNPDGSLDSSFGGGGWVATSFGDGDDGAESVAIQSNGKIIVAGYANNEVNGSTFALARYNADGSLDSTFDGDGKLTTVILSNFAQAFSVAVGTDQKIVVAGRTGLGSNFDFAVVRYNPDGSLDTSFDGDGKVTTPIGPGEDDAWSVAIQADGRIVAAGSSTDGTVGYNFDFAVVRYNENGSLDTSFDGDGKVITPIGHSQDDGDEILVQPDGKLVVVGASINANYDFDFTAVRYNSNGSLDSSFGADGKVTTPVRTRGDIAYAAAIQPNGKIVAAGSSTNLIDNDIAIVRYNPDGSLDETFSSDGMVTTDFGILMDNRLSAIAIQTDGKIVTAGSATVNFVVARYLPDGSPDTTFGSNGKVLVPSLSNYYALDAALQPDGKIVVAGGEMDSLGGAIVRLNGDGSMDTAFDGDGIVGENLISAHGVAIQPDGKILALASTLSGDSVIRYNTDGSIDNTFGTGGIVGAPFGIGDIIVQENGKIVVAGTAINNLPPDFAVARFNSNGSLDTTFDSDGMVTTSVGANDYSFSVTIQKDGKLLVAGATESNSDWDIAVVRYNTNGSLDATFDTDGKVVTGIASHDYSNAVSVQSDGKIVVAGGSGNGSLSDFALIRYNPDGSLDTDFGGGDGTETVDFNNSNDFGADMAIDPNGRAVVVGRSDEAFAIARFLLAPRNTQFDFDGDGRSDVSVFRSTDRNWYLNRSTAGFVATQFGLATDKITPADFDGDGKTDIAVFRGGTWWRINSSDNTVGAVQFGLPADRVVPADYTGDGRAELAVYRDGAWWMFNLANNQSSTVQFGLPADIPVAADYDGDGRVDQAVYRNGQWHLNRSGLGYTVVNFGLATDRPVVADYDGDGRADQSVYRDGTWYLLRSHLGSTAFLFGLSSDTPAPADYDGDGRSDPAVFRGGLWYLLQSTGNVSIQRFGLVNDKPVPAAFIQ